MLNYHKMHNINSIHLHMRDREISNAQELEIRSSDATQYCVSLYTPDINVAYVKELAEPSFIIILYYRIVFYPLF